MIRVWHKSGCSTCAKAMKSIREHCGEDAEVYEYLLEKPKQKEIKELLKLLGLKAEELIRKKESLYKEKYESKKLSNSEWIKVLAQNPILIERPIVIKGNKAFIARPLELIQQML
ncbi:MAG: arsenate reductase (glutaredoxin) [Bacteroidetes bacterium]|nr:MAG: arsenate reductase (glutaredoxin) [Bacteroidota bacterium]REK05008.1 MAG: arsenate reductase (glutaredoxin) [Bacteroidota bacterium]REK36489.1 MAG: arsenate reductase (glutaredoxin) [Bacteroidota bacterium]REK51703.1 MAG: arsenate reductase (glutaredoxin) [Bacteroidota bacterium]